MKTFFLLCCGFFLLSGQAPKEASADPITVGFKKMTYQADKKIIKYDYVAGKERRTIMCQLVSKEVRFTIMAGKKKVAELKADGKNVSYRQAGTKQWISYNKGLQKMDPYSLIVWLNQPLMREKNALTRYFPEAREEEEGFIRALRPEQGDPTTTYEGTVSSSCSCGETTITVTCRTGCGIDCREDTRTMCRVAPDGTEYDCETNTYCIGLCLCR